MSARAAGALLLAALALAAGACGGAPPPTPATPPAPPAVYNNTIRWATASEHENYGFDVYRGESEDGPFVRITPAPIEGAGTTDEPRSYVFVDDTIDPHRTYYYYVESISMSGVRERFTPIAKAGPKLPAQRSSGTGAR
ncbi:MAG TPA: hypothetical protein VF789_10725 [Thermoanaerobaculia bacterium]